jgi:predicted TIM-barrel fold metal-dependent hydrolase
MIVDAHLHVWRSLPDYPRPAVTVMSPVCDVPWELFAEYMAEHGIQRAVLVQPMYRGEDNSYVADCAAAEPERVAAVCVIDPRIPGAEDRLEYWVRQRGCRGLRLRPRNPEEAPSFGHPDTHALWQRASDLGVVVSVLANTEHLATLARMAEAFPAVPIVVDHFAHPDPQQGVQGPGFQALLALARWPHVYVKVSGYYHFSTQRYPFRDCWPLFRAVYDRFGPARLIWGSDFPHVILKTSYRRCLLMQERYYDFLRPEELKAIMGSNAWALYWPEAA